MTGTANATSFSIPLALGKVWTITLTMQKKETGDTDYKNVMQASHTFGHALTEADVTTPLTLVLEPLITENGTGKIDLSFSAGTAGLYDDVSVEINNAAKRAVWNAAVTLNKNTGKINAESIKSGIYSVTLSFFRNGALVYTITQEINVFDDMTTSRWVDSGTQNSPINNENGSFELTQDLIDYFRLTNYFVASTTNTPAGNDGNSGSPYAPLATISEALRRISVTGAEDDEYTIWLISNITENVTMPGSGTGGLDGKASSITIRPWQNGSATLNGAAGANYVLTVATTVPVTLENLTITGGSTSVSGGGMYIDSGAEVTLANCTVTGNSATGSAVSGGIYNAGTLKVKGKVIVTGNTKGTGSSAVASNVYLRSGKTITVIDTLDPDSRIGVTTEDKPTYGSPVAFTSGFENNGLEAAAISTIFTGDEGYAVLAGSGTNAGEATLAASGGNLGDVFDYAVTLSCEAAEIASGSAVTVTAAVTNAGTPVSPAASDITWNFELICFGEPVATISSYAITPASGSVRVAIPPSMNLFQGIPYTLHATAVYNGVAYDKNFELAGSRLGFVSVAGATISGAISGTGYTGSQVFIAGRTVTIPNMYVSNHEVTQAEYQAVMGTHPSYWINSPASGETQANRPVEQVNFYDAIMYCNKKSMADGLTPCYAVNGKTDPSEWGYTPHAGAEISGTITCDFNADGYRLPTDAEWEYIARGGNGLSGTQYAYSGSDTQDSIAWYSGNSNSMTHEVMKKEPNSLGIYDMTGNVDERCWDFYGSITVDTPATGPTAANGSSRIMRGGNYASDADCSNSRRFSPTASAPNGNSQPGSRGFRVVCTAPGTPLASGTTGTAGTTATYMYFGEWPQTIKASGVTVDENISKEKGAFTYYFGSDGAWYAKQAENANEAGYMYSDGTTVAQSSDETYKYFKVEPIKWRVLTTNYNGTGNKLLLAENILINHCYDPSSNNYANSEIRSYLNGDFFNSAFTSAMQSKIVTTTVNNSASTTDNSSNAYACENTDEKIFLLSYKEAENVDYDYGFADASKRVRMNTDFAKANGAFASTSNGQGGYWWLRSPYSDNADRVCNIHRDGSMSSHNYVSDGSRGVVPALCIE